MRRIVKTFKDKIALNDELESARRLAICVSCDHFIKLTKQCGLCFCYMPIKVTLKNQTCPSNKW